ncbi:hypothetical protein CLD22_19755 [Rubrivivax gelatinosus]|nr:hypothetical protein [Rubrivivax gelatinosus]
MERRARPRWRKTDLARRLLAERAPMAPALRMWLITVDGRRDEAELAALAQGLGLDGAAVIARCAADGWLDNRPEAAAEAAAPAAAAPAQRRLAAARMFAIDLAARMLAGREGDLREHWREVDDLASFERWMARCAERIAGCAGPERAGVFVERVVQVLGEPLAPG